MKFFTLAAIAAATALTLTPAVAKSKKHQRTHHYSQMQRGVTQNSGWNGGGWDAGYGGWNNGYGGWNNGWNSRNVSDPSLGHPSAGAISRYSGRCVEDLGYGRYEACGW